MFHNRYRPRLVQRSVRYTLAAVFRARAKSRCHDRAGQGKVDTLPRGNPNEGRRGNPGQEKVEATGGGVATRGANVRKDEESTRIKKKKGYKISPCVDCQLPASEDAGRGCDW